MATPLRTLLPNLAPDDDYTAAIDALEQCGIITDADLLFTEPHAIPPLRALPPSLLQTLQSLVGSFLSLHSESGDVLLDRALYPYDGSGEPGPSRSSTTLPALDDLLNGGWELGEIIEIAGSKGSGKSLLVLYSLILHLLLHPVNRAAFIDTTSSFDPNRCMDILEFLIPGLAASEPPVVFLDEGGGTEEWRDTALNVLDRIEVSTCADAGATLDSLKRAAEEEKEGLTLSIVVVDSVTPLLSGDASGTSRINSFIRRLISFSRSPSLPLTIFLINSSVPTPSHSHLPPLSVLPRPIKLHRALGPAFTYAADVSLWLTKADEVWTREQEGIVLVEVVRSRRGMAGGIVGFVSNGVQMQSVQL